MQRMALRQTGILQWVVLLLVLASKWLYIQTHVPPKSTNMFDSIMDITPAPLTSDKLQCYLATDIEDVKDRLMWWHKRCRMFPELSCMARDYLSIPGKYLVFFHLYLVLIPLSQSYICWCWMCLQLWLPCPSICLWLPGSSIHMCISLCWAMELSRFDKRWWYQSIPWSRWHFWGGGWASHGVGCHPHTVVTHVLVPHRI